MKEQLDQRLEEQKTYACWREVVVEAETLTEWIDEKVAKEWGVHAAARVWSIIKDGFDGEVEPVRNLKPHQLPVRRTGPVPGACAPIRNLFHVSQALSWIAGARNTI